jgi:hypothetical protein
MRRPLWSIILMPCIAVDRREEEDDRDGAAQVDRPPIRSRRGGGGAAYRSPADSGPTAGSGRLVETPPKTMPAGLFDDVDPALRHRSLTPAISPGPESSSDQGADSFNFLCDGPRWRTAAMGEGRETEATG